jgi:hypothetical protein
MPPFSAIETRNVAHLGSIFTHLDLHILSLSLIIVFVCINPLPGRRPPWSGPLVSILARPLLQLCLLVWSSWMRALEQKPHGRRTKQRRRWVEAIRSLERRERVPLRQRIPLIPPSLIAPLIFLMEPTTLTPSTSRPIYHTPLKNLSKGGVTLTPKVSCKVLDLHLIL